MYVYIYLYKTHKAAEGYCILPILFIATSRILFPRDSIRHHVVVFSSLFSPSSCFLLSMEKEFGLNYGGYLEITLEIP